jgi:uncharacterized protein Gcw-chp
MALNFGRRAPPAQRWFSSKETLSERTDQVKPSTMHPLSWTAAALGVHALALVADMRATQAAESQSRWALAFGSSLMSDYNFRGITASAHRPSVAAYFEPRYKIDSDLELYIGLNATSVALPNQSRIQMYYYTGVRPVFGSLSLDVAVAYVDYPGGNLFDGSSALNCTNGAFSLGSCNVSKATASYWEPFGKASLAISDTFSVTGNIFYSPSWVNTGAFGTFASSGAKIGLPNFLLPTNVAASISGEVGHYWFGTTDSFYAVPAFPAGVKLPDYTTWNAGLSFTYSLMTLDFRYYDTNLAKADCNVLTSDHTASFRGAGAVTAANPSGLSSNWCGAAFIINLSFDTTVKLK